MIHSLTGKVWARSIHLSLEKFPTGVDLIKKKFASLAGGWHTLDKMTCLLVFLILRN